MNQEQIRIPAIGEPAPTFRAETTQGIIDFPIDYSGQWIVLFSHPADFTPICTSEFVSLGNMAKEFQSLNCQLVGLSADGLASHIAWLRTIREKIEYKGIKNVEITFPLTDDVPMNVARSYGMIHPGESPTKTVRSVFFIDPKGIIRALMCYPRALGRNFDEIKRVLIGLQTIDEFSVELPAGWNPGDEVIMPSANTLETANKRMSEEPKEGSRCYDWFFCLEDLPKEDIEKKIFKK